jgi:hypothetical protein
LNDSKGKQSGAGHQDDGAKLDKTLGVQLLKDLRIKAAECEEQQNGEEGIRIIVEVGVGGGQQAVPLKNFKANDAGNNFRCDVKVQQQITANGLALERTDQYGHFEKCAEKPDKIL